MSSRPATELTRAATGTARVIPPTAHGTALPRGKGEPCPRSTDDCADSGQPRISEYRCRASLPVSPVGGVTPQGVLPRLGAFLKRIDRDVVGDWVGGACLFGSMILIWIFQGVLQ